MDEENLKNWVIIVGILIVAFIWINAKNNEIKKLKAENEELNIELSEYQYALDDANANIEEANGYIEDAQGYAWSSYEEMGYTLEELQTVDTISSPY